MTYTFAANKPGTHSYYSGTQGDLQVEMGLYGALIVLPATIPACTATAPTAERRRQAADRGNGAHADFRLAQAAYNHASACYDREYLFQFSEMDPLIHQQADDQVRPMRRSQRHNSARSRPAAWSSRPSPIAPAYFMINGRSMPDLHGAELRRRSTRTSPTTATRTCIRAN